MRDLLQIVEDIKQICIENPVMEDRLNALRQAGYENIKYTYLNGYKVILWETYQGLLKTMELPRKKVYRIQVGLTELKKGYPAAWCTEISSLDVEYKPEMPF